MCRFNTFIFCNTFTHSTVYAISFLYQIQWRVLLKFMLTFDKTHTHVHVHTSYICMHVLIKDRQCAVPVIINPRVASC